MASNPLAAMALQHLMGGLAQGADPNAGAGDGSDQNAQSAQMLSQQLSQLRAANPQLVLQELQQMYTRIAALIPHTAQSIPGVAQYLARTLGGVRGAIDAAGKALATQQTTGGPIQMSAVDNGNNAGGAF